jgi:hypothetical protein
VSKQDGRPGREQGGRHPPAAEAEPSTQAEIIDEEREEATYSPERNRLREVFLLFAALWRLVRGEDQRGRKVRWLVGLLRPYRVKVGLMFVALLAATGAALAPPYLAGRAIQTITSGVHSHDVSTLDWIVAARPANSTAKARSSARSASVLSGPSCTPRRSRSASRGCRRTRPRWGGTASAPWRGTCSSDRTRSRADSPTPA